MISGVAHELNNPLTAIMGNAELMFMNKTLPKESFNHRKSYSKNRKGLQRS